MSAIIKFPVEDFRTSLAYSCVEIRKKDSLKLESAGNAIWIYGTSLRKIACHYPNNIGYITDNKI